MAAPHGKHHRGHVDVAHCSATGTTVGMGHTLKRVGAKSYQTSIIFLRIFFHNWFNGSNTNHEESTPSDWSVRWRCLYWIPLADPSPLQSPDGFRQSRWTSCLCNVKTRHILSRKRWKERYMHSEVSKHNNIYYASPFKPHIYIYWPWLKDKKRRMPFHGMKETICNSWWFNWPEPQKGIRERERAIERLKENFVCYNLHGKLLCTVGLMSCL